jgi:hypothetical protein
MAIRGENAAEAVRQACGHGMDVSEHWSCRPDTLGTAGPEALGKHLTRDEAAELALIPCEPTGSDYASEYASYWRDIIEHADGTLNMDQMMRELADYSMLIKQVSEAYDEVTGSRISKPLTLPVHVINAVNERITEAEERAIRDLIESIEKHGSGPYASAADVIAAIRELTGIAGLPAILAP